MCARCQRASAKQLMYTLRRGSIQGGEDTRLPLVPASSTAQLMHALVGQHLGGWDVQLRALPASSCHAASVQKAR